MRNVDMRAVGTTAPETMVDSHFESSVQYWDRIYDANDVGSVIYQRRQDAVLERIDDLKIRAGSHVLEIGCGTGRNLVAAARLYPDARFFGVDVSTEMLTSAITAFSRHSLTNRIRVAHGDGTAFDPAALFGVPLFDDVMISYSLSMIPDWRGVLRAAASRLKPGGRLHVVDFGGQERLPVIARALLRRWLAMFDVTPRDDLWSVLSGMADAPGASLKFERPFRGYAQYAVLTSAPEPAAP